MCVCTHMHMQPCRLTKGTLFTTKVAKLMDNTTRQLCGDLQSPAEPIEDHPSTHGCLTHLRNPAKEKTDWWVVGNSTHMYPQHGETNFININFDM